MPQSVRVCPDCGAPMPLVRKPTNLRQALWGGWNCPQCGCEVDRHGGRYIPKSRRISRTRDDTTTASHPGRIPLSHARLRRLRPDLYGPSGWLTDVKVRLGLRYPMKVGVAEQLWHGDARAAVVVSTDPLLVAAFSDDLDCVAMLEFDDTFVADYGLRVGSKLLTVNGYRRMSDYDADLIVGPGADGPWTGFQPLIAEFLSDDLEAIKARKAGIADSEWRKAYRLGKAYLQERPGLARDGRPGYAAVTAKAPTRQ